jgi:hypothetical protein
LANSEYDVALHGIHPLSRIGGYWT